MRTMFYALILVAAAMLAACGSPASTETPPESTPTQGVNWMATVVALQEAVDEMSAAEAEAQAEVEEAPAVEPTQAPAVVATTAPIQAPVVEVVVPVDNGNPVVTYDWGSANVPSEVITAKRAGSPCYMPDPTCYVFNAAGVLGADDYDEAMANASAVWTGSAVYHNKPQGPVVGDTVPEAGYWSAFAQSFDVEVGGYHLVLNRTENVCGWGLLIRGLFSEDGVDRHTPITFSNYGAVGAASYTRYAVPVEAGQYFSQDYWTDQFESGLDFDNCGIGDKDAFAFYGGVLDLNDGSLTVLYYDEGGWATDAVYTNVVGHGSK